MANTDQGTLIDQYKLLHAEKSEYGTTSAELVPEISVAIDYLKPKTVLDFGCGKGAFLEAIASKYPEIKFYGFDPAIPGRETIPLEKFDMIINTDVLEHIPEDELPAIVEKLSSLSQNVYFNLHHRLAKEILPNGQNAHCTVKPPEWYRALLSKYFTHVTLLKGRASWLSVAVTFPVPDKVKDQYMDAMEKATNKPLLSRLARKIKSAYRKT